jgi:hypothetical protein
MYFPHLLEQVYEFALSIIRSRPKFLVNLIRLIDAMALAHAQGNPAQASGASAQGNTNPLVLRMLVRFEEVLCKLPPRKLESYLPLAERIVMEYQIDPTVYSSLFAFLSYFCCLLSLHNFTYFLSSPYSLSFLCFTLCPLLVHCFHSFFTSFTFTPSFHVMPSFLSFFLSFLFPTSLPIIY